MFEPRAAILALFPCEVVAAIVLSILLWKYCSRQPANYLIFAFLPMIWLNVIGFDAPLAIHFIRFPGRCCDTFTLEEFACVRGITAVVTGLPTASMATLVAYKTRTDWMN
jgi:hypothetical protein